MLLRYLQFGLLFSALLCVLKVAGAPGLLDWSWGACFLPVPVAGGFCGFCVLFAFIAAIVDTAGGRE